MPLSAKSVGTGLLPFHEPLNPKVVLPPVGMRAVVAGVGDGDRAPDWVTVPFHSWVMVCPAPNDQVSRQPFTASP